jgi:CheY-like chemotaxis protein
MALKITTDRQEMLLFAGEGNPGPWFVTGHYPFPTIEDFAGEYQSNADSILGDVLTRLWNKKGPGCQGVFRCERKRRDGVTDYSHIIMLTASVSEQDVRQAIDMGASGYLAKPLNIRLLMDRADRVLRPAESQPPSSS